MAKSLIGVNNSIAIKIYYSVFIFVIITTSFLFLTNGYTFVSDDWEIIRVAKENPFPLASDWKANDFGMYRPLVVLSYFINFIISEYNAVYYYLFNLFIHYFATVIFFKILSNILVSKFAVNKTLPLIITGIYFLLPQNIMNLLWIAGRTDLLATFFMLLGIFFLQKFIIKKNTVFITFAFLSQLLAMMSKETAVIFPIYWIFIVFINKEELTKNQLLITSVAGISLLVAYIITRYLIFGSGMLGQQNFIELSLSSVANFIIYGFSSLVIPFDILDILYLIQNNKFFTIILFFLGIIAAYLFFSLFLRSSNKQIISLGVIFTVLSLLVYIGNYPQMRLMYAHLPLLLISCAFLFYSMGKKEWIFLCTFWVLVFISDYLLINRNSEIQYHTKSLLTSLPSKDNYDSESQYLVLTALGRIGQSWARPWPNLMQMYKIGSEDEREISNFSNVLVYETYSLTEYENLIQYKLVGDNKFQITILEDSGILVPEASYKFNDPYNIPKGVVDIEPISFSHFRQYAATSCNVTLDTTRNINVIFWDGIKYSLKSRNEFIDWVQDGSFTFSR